MAEPQVVITQTTVSGGTTNNNLNTSNSSSFVESHATSRSVNIDTSTVTSNSTNESTSRNYSESVSNDTSHVTSVNTTNSNSVSKSESTDTSFVTSHNTTNSTSTSNSISKSENFDTTVTTTNSTTNSTSNSTNFSQSDIEVAIKNAEANNYGADKSLAGVLAHEQAETLRLGQRLAWADGKFEALFPLIEGVFSGGSSSGESSGGIGFQASIRPTGLIAQAANEDFTAHGGDVGYYSRRSIGNSPLGFRANSLRMGGGDVKTDGIGFAAGGDSVADSVAATSLPFIRTAGVLTPSQVQQSINAATARNDARTQSELHRLTSSMSGRGFSSNSPILAALQASLAGSNLRANIEGATRIQLESAKLNADAIFQRQKAVSDQFIQQEQVLVEETKAEATRAVGILTAVSQMVSSAI